MDRYVVHHETSDVYVGYRTSEFKDWKTIPRFMFTKYVPCVGPEEARLYRRQQDAKAAINVLEKDYGIKGLSIKIVKCFLEKELH